MAKLKETIQKVKSDSILRDPYPSELNYFRNNNLIFRNVCTNFEKNPKTVQKSGNYATENAPRGAGSIPLASGADSQPEASALCVCLSD